MSHALQLENVTVILDGEVILKNLSLQIHHGDTVVIMGPSGSGKTVLLKTMAGLFVPTHGRVLCEGEDWQNLQSKEKRALSKKIGMSFQQSALFDSLSVYENVAFPLREHTTMSESAIEERVLECLEAVGLQAAKEQMPHELSGGMKHRLGIARAIALHPQIIFYDDPTAGLDPINSDKMAELIIKLKKDFNSTVIVVTNDIMRAFQLAGRIWMIIDQEVIETGDAVSTRKFPDARVQKFIRS